MRIDLDNVLGTFNKALGELEKFTQQCDQYIAVYETQLENISQQKVNVEKQRQRAVNYLSKIIDIVG